MREERILSIVGNTVTAGVRPDFADLLRRIESDNGASTAPQMTASRGGAGKVIAYTAAGIAAAAALGTMTLVGLSSGAMSSESAAFDAECEAPMASESLYESDWGDMTDNAAPMEPSADEEPEESEEPVSDSDAPDDDSSDEDADLSDEDGDTD